MNPTLHAALLFLHLLGVIVWVGGMAFAHFVMRPAAVAVLPPPQRLPLLAAALQRFFRIVAVAVGVIIGTGLWRLGAVGFAQAPPAWHTMMGLGLAMALVFVYVYAALLPRLRAAVGLSQWPVAAGVLDRIRRLVFANLCLGVLTVAVAYSARAA